MGMSYRTIIQEMKETGDPNILAFLSDVERIGKMTSRQRHYYLENRQMPCAVDKIVKDFIPYIIKKAYVFSRYTKSLTILDLVNEGVFGAYAALAKRSGSGKPMTRCINTYIIHYIINALRKDHEQRTVDCKDEDIVLFDEDLQTEDSIIEDINREWERSLLTEMILEKIGSRNGNIILEYYLNCDYTLEELGKKYGVSGERVRQITHNFAKLYKKTANIKTIRQMCYV